MANSRLLYIDNIKIFLIILVILHHVGQGYGPTGGWWFYMSSQPEKLEWMGRFFAVNASFFMGLFFMISGYFFAPSFDKKGFKKYTIDKLIRYGIPLVFVYWLMMPFIFYFHYELYSDNPSLSFSTYFEKIYLGIGGQPEWFKPILTWPERNFGFGHLWFVENLLVYALLYGVLRLIFRKASFAGKLHLNAYAFSVVFFIVVASSTILVRNYYQVGDIKSVLGFLMIEVAHWPIYLGFLISGIVASQTEMFQKFPSVFGISLLMLGLGMAVKIYFPFLFPDMINTWAGQYFEIYETVLGFSLSFGLVVLFRDYLNFTNRLFSDMAENAYAAYIFHYPIVIAIQYGFDKLPIGVFAKFIVVGALSIIATFAFSNLIRKPKFVRRII